MKIYLAFILLLLREANSGPAKKGPAFSTPVYSDSFLPAAMQVIFYAVEQLKSLQVEETEQTTTIMSTTLTTTVSTTVSTTMSQGPGQQQPEATAPSIQLSTEKPVLSQEASIVEMENSNDNPSTPSSDKEMPEMGEETPEINYGTPETNHEIPEESHETQEVNQETPQPEKDITLVDYSKDKLTNSVSTTSISVESQQSNKSNLSSSSSSSSSSEASSEEDKDGKIKNKVEPTVDSVVQEIYGIMKPQNKTKNSSEEAESNESRESNDESDEEDNDENRFTLLGEKVTQVPRPSLSTYLRRSKIPPKCSVQQLALLYDALSKDARKQGFAKFSGYSDEVLKTLETSAEGGIGPQLQKLLEKILERNEVTRDDAKVKITGMLKELKEPGSEINKDLRPLIPLRFNP